MLELWVAADLAVRERSTSACLSVVSGAAPADSHSSGLTA